MGEAETVGRSTIAFGMPETDTGEWHVGPVTIEGEVAEFIRMRIRSGELRAGDRLPSQRELAILLGVARPTLRQALKTLETQGYVLTTRGAARKRSRRGSRSRSPLATRASIQARWPAGMPQGKTCVYASEGQSAFGRTARM